MNEHQPTPETHAQNVDLRRLQVVAQRFSSRIEPGIAYAASIGGPIDTDTARMIAHVLGRSLGPESHLSEFGRVGSGNYRELRDEHLRLWRTESIDPIIHEWIAWLGAHLAQLNGLVDGPVLENANGAPDLDRLLVSSPITIRGQRLTIRVPASLNSCGIDEVMRELENLDVDKDDALQAYFELSDTNAAETDLMERFHGLFFGTFDDLEDVLRALSPLEEWEADLGAWMAKRGIDLEALTWNLEPLYERLVDSYELVEMGGRIHAFVK